MSGGLISIALFLRGWSATKSKAQFRSMAKHVFQKPQYSQRLLGKARQCLRSWLADGYYSTANLEETLQESYGPDAKMFDHMATNSGVKVAVTAATLGDATTYIFSNYNGTKDRLQDCGKSCQSSPSLYI